MRPERQVHDREIDLSVRGVSHELGRAYVMDPQSHGGVPAVKPCEEPGEVDLTKRLDGADRQVPAHQPADRGNGVPAVLGRGEGADGGWKQRPSGFGQLDLAGAAHEQVATEFAFERAD